MSSLSAPIYKEELEPPVRSLCDAPELRQKTGVDGMVEDLIKIDLALLSEFWDDLSDHTSNESGVSE